MEAEHSCLSERFQTMLSIVDTRGRDNETTPSNSPRSSSSVSEHWGLTAVYRRQWQERVKRRPKSIPLRSLAKLAVMSVRLCRQSMENLARQKGEYESVMQVLDEYGAKLTWRGMSFNPTDYRANKQRGLHKGARRLLEIDPNTRNENDINTLLVALRNIPAFAEYPKKMQKKLCQVGRLETYEPRRVILREGDPPSSFYFILSGTVLVTAFEETTGTSRTLVVLNKGMSFGELAVISNTKRQATVCSKTEIELLSISGQEFEEIFMAGGRDVMANEKQQQFIRSVRFLQHWPTNELRGNTESCSIYYFDRNQVLVRDSNNSDWIYIVLKGSLSVIKKLKAVDPQHDVILAPKRPKVTFSKHHCRRDFKKKRSSDRSWIPGIWKRGSGDILARTVSDDVDINNNTQACPSLWEPHNLKIPQTQPKYFKNMMELEYTLEQTLPGYHNTVDRLGSLDYDRIVQEHKSRLVQRSPPMDSRRHVENRDLDEISRTGVRCDSNINLPAHENTDRKNDLVTNELDYLSNSSPNRSPVTTSQKKQRSSGKKDCHRRNTSPSFLPDISINNKVAGYHSERENENDNDSRHENDEEGNEADNEDRFSPSSIGGLNTPKSTIKKARRIRKTLKGVYLASSKHEKQLSDKNEKTHGQREDRMHVPEKTSSVEEDLHTSFSSQYPAKLKKEETVSEKLAKLQIQYQRRITDGEGRKTIAEELDYKARRDFKFTEADLDPTIIELQVLERGQYFGLSSILFPDQPSLSVISNGAECVVMSKKFFLQLASEKCITTLRQTETPYPSDQQLGRKLQEAVNWQASRSAMFKKLQDDVFQKQTKRKQFPSYQGQYCFRTGPT